MFFQRLGPCVMVKNQGKYYLMKQHYIRPIALARGVRKKGSFKYRMIDAEEIFTSCYVWYIEGAKPNILVDAGETAEMFRKRGRVEEHIQSLDEGLGKVGLKPEDINIVILTHLHSDHVALASRYTKARFIVQKAEIDFALNPHPLAAGSYHVEQFNDLNFDVISGDKEITDGVSVLLTPGHTPGGQSVAVSTPAGTAIITGFCCLQDNFDPPKGGRDTSYEVVPPGYSLNALDAYDSLVKVKRCADIVVAIHDIMFQQHSRIPA